MKPRSLLTLAAVMTAVALTAACLTEETPKSVAADDLGLSKTSVFSTPAPIVPVSTAKEPGENELVGAYFTGSPPLISHAIEDYLPIRIGENLCLDCHALPDEIGRKPAQGDPTPVPASHYTDLRRNPDEVTQEVTSARFLCTQCHAPQLDASPLVANTYRQ